MKYESFRMIHSHPEEYLAEALEAFENAQGKAQVRRIIALAMQKLDLESYLDFLKATLQMLQKGTINIGDFKSCCFPSYEWNTTLAEHYALEPVKEFLELLMAAPQLPKELKAYIGDHLMSGKAYQQIQYLRRIGEIK